MKNKLFDSGKEKHMKHDINEYCCITRQQHPDIELPSGWTWQGNVTGWLAYKKGVGTVWCDGNMMWDNTNECYPAVVGLAVLRANGVS